MTQRSHVPKFGNWDGDNVPYTAYFENAQKEKVGGVKMFNPNDPEENPEAFMFGRVEDGSDGVFNAVPAPAAHVGFDKPMSAEKDQMEEHKQPYRDPSNTSDHQKSVSHKSTSLESSSDKSNSDNSLLLPNHRHKRSEKNKNTTESSISLHSPSPGHSRQRSGSNAYNDTYRSASMPKFGAWNEQDPESGVGFTVIFDKVKAVKQNAAATLPVPPQPSNYPKSEKKGTGSKIYCCMFPSATK